MGKGRLGANRRIGLLTDASDQDQSAHGAKPYAPNVSMKQKKVRAAGQLCDVATRLSNKKWRT